MNTVESYNFENEIGLSTDLSSDSFEFKAFFPDTEYCDLNIDLFSPNVLETFNSQFIDDHNFEAIFSSAVTSPTNNKVNVRNEDTFVTDSHRFTSPNSKFDNVGSLEDDDCPLLPFDEPPIKFDIVESERGGNIEVKNCLTETVIKEEVKDNGCHFVPNSPEYLPTATAQNQKPVSKRNSTSPCIYNGNIADLVKTRKRTCNNSKVKNALNVKVKTKNRSAIKKEPILNNSTDVKSATKVPLLSSKIPPDNSNSQLHSFNTLKIKMEPEEHIEQFDTLKHLDSQDSMGLYNATNKFLKERQKCESLPSQENKAKSKQQKERLENYSATLVKEKNLDYTDFRIHKSFSSGNRDCQKLEGNFANFKNKPVTQAYFASLESQKLPSDLSLTYTNINLLKDDDLFAPTVDVRSSPVESFVSKSSRQGESTSLLKLRISRCANQFKSYVIPAEPIPAPHSPDIKKKLPKYFNEMDEPMSSNQNKHLLDGRENREEFISKTEKRKRKKSSKKRGSHQKSKPNNQIHYDSDTTIKTQVMNTNPLKIKTVANNGAESIPVILVKTESKDVSDMKVAEEQDCVLNQKVPNFLQDDVLIHQPFDVKKADVSSDGNSEKQMINNSFPKARKKIKKINTCDIFEKSLFNDQSDCDSNIVINDQEYDASVHEDGSKEPVKSVPIKKIKKEPIDTYEYSEFEMHQSVELPISDFCVPFASGHNASMHKAGFKEIVGIVAVTKIKKDHIDTYEYSEFEMHQSVEVPLNDLNHIRISNEKAVDILGFKPKKSISSFSHGNLSAKQNTLNKEFDFNKVVIKSEEISCKKVLDSDSVSSNTEPNLKSKQQEGIFHTSESNSRDLLYLSKENLHTSPSTCDFDLQNDTYDTFDSMPFLKSTNSQGSSTSSQGTIVNSENYFQESEATVESNTENIAKELIKNDFSSSPPFSDCDENITNDSKLSPVTNMERGFFESKTSDQELCSSGIENESTEIQRDSTTSEVFDSKSEAVVHATECCLQAPEAKCTDLKAIELKQCPEANDETTQSANSAFLIATMQNSFHFQIRKFSDEVPNQTVNNTGSKGNSSGDNTSEPSSLEPKEPPRSRTGVRQYRSRKRSRSSSSSSDSFYDYKTSKRVKKYRISRRKELLESSRKKSYCSKQRKSSPKSSYSESRSCSRYSYSSTYDERSKSPVESFRKTEKRKHYSSRSWSRRRRPRSSSHSPSRSPGPQSQRYTSCDRSVSASRKSVVLEEQEKQTNERRVVYVGQIPDGFSTSELRDRFGRFGRIEDINIHRKNSKRNNNFGFVTFKYTQDACEAVARGNDPPLKPKFDISFGGRRLFCRQRYSDLDKEKELVENNDYYYPPPKANDFDSLLNAELVRTGLQDKKY